MAEDQSVPVTPARSAYFSLPRRHQKFVDIYVDTGVGTEAMRRIKPKCKRPDVAASKLLAMPEVKAAVLERTQEAIAAAGITHYNVMRELARIITFDHRKLYDENGDPIALHELPEDLARGLAQVEVEEVFIGVGDKRIHTGNIRKYRGFPKVEAIKLALQYQNLLTEKHEHTGAGGTPLAPPVINIGFGNGGPGESSPSAKGT